MTSRREFLRHSIWASGTLLLGAGACTGRCADHPRPVAHPPGNGRDGLAASRRAMTAHTPTPTPKAFSPAYLALERSGELARREAALWKILSECHLCPRDCGGDRLAGEKGDCKATALKVHSAGPHFGEERPLVGRGGSGTVFFSHCGLRCEYCQNWEIAHRGDGRGCSHAELAGQMLSLQRIGCHNINLVTPTHFVPQIVKALRLAIGKGLRLPLVYNTGGYDTVEVIRLLDGVVDIYMPDFKYQDGAMAARYSRKARDYPRAAAAAIAEMHRQVGSLRTDSAGIAQRGLILRHLVLPHNIAGTDRFVRWVASKLGPETYVNLMAQYRPAHRAGRFPKLARSLTQAEWRQALAWARAAGLRRLDAG